jgi:tetratricopeptide (TPR) repeat protein
MSESASPIREPEGLAWKGTDRYAVVRCIGQGGMGVVYEAFDRERRCSVALKTILRFDADGLYRFKQEFRTLADVKHANLVHLHDLVASDSGAVFFTMELVHGTDFARYVEEAGSRSEKPSPALVTRTATPRRPGVEPPERVSEVLHEPAASATSPANVERLRSALRQLVQGVQAIHAAGKVHRDIKPSNVLVTPRGRLVILDFGVAADLSHVEPGLAPGASEMVGTASYMAPEQATANDSPASASDWYSVGVMLYEALVGRRPFVGSAVDVVSLKIAMDPPPPSECVSGVPPDLDALCVELLRRDPTQRPNGDEILQRLGGVPTSAPPAPPLGEDAGGLIVGRDEELRALREAARAAAGGRSVTVLVGGGPGMGRSTIVHGFLDELAEDDAVILRGRAYEREAVPYKAVDEVVDALSRHLMRQAEGGQPALLPDDVWALARLFPVLRRVPGVPPRSPAWKGDTDGDADARSLRHRAFDALRELLASMAEVKPLVVLVDDAHWGDLDSAALLLELVRPPDAPPLLLLMTYEDGEADKSPLMSEMRRLWPGGELREVTLGPLDTADAQRLALTLLGATEGATEGASDERSQRISQAVAREARGSPFLVEELVRSHRTRISADGETLVLMTLDQLVGHRLERLSPEAKHLIEMVAVGGRPLPVSVLAIASGIGEGINDAVALLGYERLARTSLRDGREAIEATHDRIRETIAGRLPAAVVREHHRRLASALEDTPSADLEALATHMLGAGDTQRAAQYALKAAEQAAEKLAFDQAARLFRLALETVHHDEAAAQLLRVRLAQALESAGHSSEAADAYEEAARRATGIERVELERSAAEQIVASGRIDAGAAALRRVLAAMGMRAPRSALGALVWFLFFQLGRRIVGSRFHERAPETVSRDDRVRVEALRAVSEGLGTVDVILGAAMQARHMLLAMRVGDRLQVLRAMCFDLIQCAVADHSESRRERKMYEAARGLASRSGIDGQLQLEGARGLALYMRGRFHEALEVLDVIYANFGDSRLRNSAAEKNLRLFAVYACYHTGRLREEARRAALLLRHVESQGDFYTSVCLRSTVMVDIRLAADDPDGARRHLSEAMAQWTRIGFSVQHWYAMVSTANIELYVGDGAKARSRIERDMPALKRSFLLHSRFIRGFTDYLRAICAVASIDTDPSLRSARVREARHFARGLEREPAPWSRVLGALARSAAANAAGERAEAIDALREAIARSEEAHMRLHAWAAGHQLGSLLGGEEGAVLLARAERAMSEEGVRAPARMARLFVPGRWEP